MSFERKVPPTALSKRADMHLINLILVTCGAWLFLAVPVALVMGKFLGVPLTDIPRGADGWKPRTAA